MIEDKLKQLDKLKMKEEYRSPKITDLSDAVVHAYNTAIDDAKDFIRTALKEHGEEILREFASQLRTRINTLGSQCGDNYEFRDGLGVAKLETERMVEQFIKEQDEKDL